MHSQAHNQVDHMPKSQVLTTNIFTSNSTTKIIGILLPFGVAQHRNDLLTLYLSLFFLVIQTANISNKSPNMRRHSSVLKKHVQFPEDFKYIEEEEILCTTDSNGTGSGTGSASGWIITKFCWMQTIVSSRNEFTKTSIAMSNYYTFTMHKTTETPLIAVGQPSNLII